MSKRKIIVNIVTACLLTAIAIGAFVMANRSRPNPQDLPPALPEGMEYSIGNTVAIGHFENMDDMEFDAMFERKMNDNRQQQIF